MNMKTIIGALIALVVVAAVAWFGGFLSPEPTKQAATPAATETVAETPAEPETAAEPEPEPQSAAEVAPEPETVAEPETAAETEAADSGNADPAPATEEEIAALRAAAEPPGGATRDIGWMHGDCLLAESGDLEAGTAVTVVALDDPQTVLGGEITGIAEGDEACNLLDGGRQADNKDQGSFYTVKTPQVLEFAIAVVHSDDAGKAPDPQMMDVDESGVLDAFSHCMTAEGVRFSVWNGEPYHSKELWRGNYALARDTMPTCPE